jgi:hypothetical protein
LRFSPPMNQPTTPSTLISSTFIWDNIFHFLTISISTIVIIHGKCRLGLSVFLYRYGSLAFISFHHTYVFVKEWRRLALFSLLKFYYVLLISLIMGKQLSNHLFSTSQEC